LLSVLATCLRPTPADTTNTPPKALTRQIGGLFDSLVRLSAIQGQLMNRSVRIKNFLTASLLFFCAFPSYASTSINLLNIFYFEHAYVSANDCASRGFPTNSIHADWINKNASTHDQISNEVINDFVKRGLNNKQAENELQGVREQYRRQALSETQLSNTLCGAFREYLSNISTLKDSKYKSTRAK
jgi:hypothetical protein